MWKVEPIAPIKSVMYRSETPKELFCYSPGICALPSGRLVGTMDRGGPKAPADMGQVFLSDDRGESWRKVATFPFLHARPFVAGSSLYVLGHNGELRIIRSDDDGETWSDYASLTHGDAWHQAPASVIYSGDYVYLVMESFDPQTTGWPVRALRPVLMRGNIHTDLTKRENWTFAKVNSFEELVDYEKTDYFGIPFYSLDRDTGVEPGGRYCAPIGWLETNVVQIHDPNHIWYDPTGHTFYLFMRAHTGRTGYCCVAKVVEKEDGTMEMETVKAPTGKTLLYLPMPGGQMKFHILYDEVSRLYWLLSSQATDSMIDPEKMPSDRYNLPDNERHRLQLHFSKNCVDWCFAGLIDMGATALESRHYASMTISGDDLYILSRTGDKDAATPHNTNMISLHEVKNFRELVY
ncbi:MAG: exo-alpha-sialidase [Clostridia bacterium]|nr:exo-alpha-sialidase [Clostridia bacterium]